MFHEVILEGENIENYYFNSKATAKKDKPRNFIEDKNGEILKFIDEISTISGIYKDEESFKQYIQQLMPGSFGIRFEFELSSSYFSKDDDEFYVVPNSVLKEYICKIPMIRGSNWKGILSAIGLKIIKEELYCEDIPTDKILENYMSMARIFGTGSENFRNLEKALNSFVEENGKEEALIQCLIKYALFDLGINIKIDKNGESIVEQILEQIIENKNKACSGLLTQKGRAIFYPTYFNQLGFEVLKPSDREVKKTYNRNKKKNSSPIFFEVVPKENKGTFQMAYIPFDGVLETRKALESQQKKDFEFLKAIIEKALSEKGIGAKTKIGWGRVKEWKEIKCIK
ncbi:MAG: hypothetical protein ACFWUE_08350 [Xylanivirga thermophila]|jgi:CRISPR-associated protein Cmr2|uniref:RAMP superfamily CRISPR-associated protein n=1 Tax=Xylanivirga thermophila TaxID=2496273 RepID=UPI0039F45DB3